MSWLFASVSNPLLAVNYKSHDFCLYSEAVLPSLNNRFITVHASTIENAQCPTPLFQFINSNAIRPQNSPKYQYLALCVHQLWELEYGWDVDGGIVLVRSLQYVRE